MSPQELVGDLMARLVPGAMVSSAIVIAEVIVPGQAPTAYAIWDSDSAPWTHEGLMRTTLRRVEGRTPPAVA